MEDLERGHLVRTVQKEDQEPHVATEHMTCDWSKRRLAMCKTYRADFKALVQRKNGRRLLNNILC